MKTSSITTKQYYYIFVAISILGVLSIVAALYFGNARLSEANKSTSVLLAERDVAREKLSRLTTVSSQANEAEAFEKTVTAIIPKSKEQQSLVAEIIYKATSEADIRTNQITSFSFSGDNTDTLGDLSGTTQLTSPSGVYEYPFSVSISEISYAQLLKLFTEIESNQRLIQVSNADITPNGATAGSLDVNLVMKAYVQP